MIVLLAVMTNGSDALVGIVVASVVLLKVAVICIPEEELFLLNELRSIALPDSVERSSLVNSSFSS